MAELSGAVVVVTGAARGIGRVMTRGFAQAGASVGALDRDHGAPFDGPGAGAVVPVTADITQDASVVAARDAALARFGRVDVVVADAALRRRNLFPPAGLSTVLDAGDAGWRAMFEVDVLGTLTVRRRFVPLLVEAGGGSVVAVGTGGTFTHPSEPGVWAAARPVRLNQPYEASKAALTSLVLTLAGASTTSPPTCWSRARR